jgi:hypothetical protein
MKQDFNLPAFKLQKLASFVKHTIIFLPDLRFALSAIFQ